MAQTHLADVREADHGGADGARLEPAPRAPLVERAGGAENLARQLVDALAAHRVGPYRPFALLLEVLVPHETILLRYRGS